MSSNPGNRKNPYVGPPAFQFGQTLYGRDREVAELLDLLIVERIVTLYSPSGAGKSSLINAGLIPALVKSRFKVLPVIRVGKEFCSNDSNAKKVNRYVWSTLVSLNEEPDSERSVPSTELENLTLPEYFETALKETSARAGTVLIFDQFEEILTADPTDQEEKLEFFTQIGSLLQNPGYWALFSMREEHYAGLQPYLHLIPTGLSTTYRLELLGPDDAKKAIRQPAKDAGVFFEDDVATDLVDDLREVKVRQADGTTEDRPGPFVEPLHLQVVCESLWKELPSSATKITSDDLSEFGDVNQALRKYYENALSATNTATAVRIDDLRGWFDEYLITPGGTRGMAYRDSEYTGRGGRGIPNAAVDELQKQHIVRAEKRGTGERWYELTHDRFIGPINEANSDWRESEKTRQKWRRGLQVFGFVLFIILAVFVKDVWDSHREFENYVEKPIEMLLKIGEVKTAFEKEGETETTDERLPSDVQNVLDSVATYLWTNKPTLSDKISRFISLFPKGNVDNVEVLSEKIESVQHLIPEQYGIDQSITLAMPSISAEEQWPIVVTFNPDRKLNQGMIQYHWRILVPNMATIWGIPAPNSLKFAVDEHLPVDEINVTTADTALEPLKQINLTKRTVSVPSLPGFVLVTENGMPHRLKPWFDRNKPGWQEVMTLKHGGPWWLVPKWTAPLFKAAGHPISPREAAVAIAVGNLMLDSPELMLNGQNVALMLKQLEDGGFSITVNEALATRGGLDGLVGDLREVVREDYPLTRLRYLLDTLATFPTSEYTSKEAASFSVENPSDYHAPSLMRLVGRRKETGPDLTKMGLELEKDSAYSNSITWLEVEPPIRVYLGDKLIDEFVKNVELRPEILESLADLRGEVFKRFGIEPPAVKFRYADGDLQPNAFRIEILDETQDSEDAKPILVDDKNNTRKMFTENLERRYLLLRDWWIDAEYVNRQLMTLPETLKEWLLKRYTLTDIKSVLRRVVATSDEELDAYAAGGLSAALDEATPGQSLRYFSWLMTSLPFWVQVSGRYDTQVLANNLQMLQNRRTAPTETAVEQGKIGKLITEGIFALDKQNLAVAEGKFSQAVKINKQQAIQTFIDLYTRRPQVTFEGQLTELKSYCKPPSPGKLKRKEVVSLETRYSIEDLLSRYAQRIESADRRALEICLFEHYSANNYHQHARAFVQLLLAGERENSLSANEKYLLAYGWLELEGEVVLKPKNLPQVENLLIKAFGKWTRDEVATAESAYFSLISRYETGWPPLWYSRLLERIAELHSDSYWIAYDLGRLLSQGRSVQDGENAITWLERARERLPRSKVSEEKWPIHQAWINFHIAQAWLTKAEQGRRTERKTRTNEAIRLLREQISELLASDSLKEQGWPSKETYKSLMLAYRLVNDIPMARRILDEAEQSFGPNDFYDYRFPLYLTSSDAHKAVDLARSVLDSPAVDRTSALFWNALSQLLTHNKDATYAARRFIATKHAYVDYIRMMLYWSLKTKDIDERAQAPLEERWREIDPSMWEGRVNNGDPTVWREMLIGYYLGRVAREDIFGPIESREIFESSPFSLLGVQGLSYDGMRCEAYFYDALLQVVSGDPKTRQQRYKLSLEKALDAGHAQFFEYLMADYLLSQMAVELPTGHLSLESRGQDFENRTP